MLTDQGTVLRTYPLRENSLILVWLTSGHGLIRTAARSIRKPGNALHGHADLFYHCEMGWSTPKTGDLNHLTAAAVVNAREGIRADYNRFALASYFARLVLSGIEADAPVPEFFDLTQRALHYLDSHDATRRAMLHFERELSRIHGVYRDGQPAWQALNTHSPVRTDKRKILWDRLPER